MKKALTLAALALFGASSAMADGFVCQANDGGLNVKVYNHTDADLGTRSAAIMVLSNPEINYGRKTIASFKDTKSTLAAQGATYVANVDLRVSESNRGGELIAGTKLGQVKTIVLGVDFTYALPVENGTEVPAEMTIIKRNNEEITLDLTCVRYLKGE